jgi:acetoin utilization deacetylase AcuC-like enzyme
MKSEPAGANKESDVQRTGIVIDERYLEHRNPGPHPERPERIAALLKLVDELPPERFRNLEPRLAERDELLTVHSETHVDRIAASRGRKLTVFDPDTTASAQSYETALLAAGGLLALTDGVMAGEVANGFAFVRPPGHHAERESAMGFCLFNNVAIAAEHLRRRHGLRRVTILDWDVHHGNGTQSHFLEDPNTLYVSLHQFPHYPGTGAAAETGEGAGAGTTVNVPLPAGSGDADYLDAFARIVEPIARQFAPEFLLISAGWDGHEDDPLSGHLVTTSAYTALTRRTLALAEDLCGGRCAGVLEGGYATSGLVACAGAALREMSGQGTETVLPEPTERTPAVDAVIEHQKKHWRLIDAGAAE